MTPNLPAPLTVRSGDAHPRDVVVVLLDSLNRHMLGALRRHRVRHAEPRPARGPVGAVHQPPHRLAAVHAGPPRPARAARSTSRGGRGGRSRCGRTPITRLLRRDAGVSTMLVSATTRTCSRPAARTTTPTSAPGTTSAATRTTRGAPGPTRRGSARRRCRRRRAPFGARLRHSAARGSATRPTSPARARWPAAAAWLDRELGAARDPTSGRCCVVDEFDPHEPFDTPEPWASRYDPDWEGERLIWPPYARDARPSRASTEREGRHLRAQYGAKLVDDRPLARPDPRRRRPARRVGHHRVHPLHRPRPLPRRARHLGQAAGAGAPRARPHPAAVAWPGRRAAAPATRSRRPSTCTPRCATSSASTPEHRTHGRSLVPLLDGTATSVREWALVRRVGPGGPRRRRHPHVRQGAGRGEPAAVDVLEPLVDDADPRASPSCRLPRPDDRAPGSTALPGSDVPVIRQPFDPSDDLPFWARGPVQRRPALRPGRGDATGEVRNQAGGAATRR